MTKFNIQFSVDNELEFTKTFKTLNESELSSEEITELCKNLLVKLINKLEEKKVVEKTLTVLKPTNVIFKIDNVEYKLKTFTDAIKYVFEYLIDNDYINDEHDKFMFLNMQNKILYCKEEDSHNYRIRRKHIYKGFVLEAEHKIITVYANIMLLINYFNIQDKLEVTNWPKLHKSN